MSFYVPNHLSAAWETAQLNHIKSSHRNVKALFMGCDKQIVQQFYHMNSKTHNIKSLFTKTANNYKEHQIRTVSI